MERAELCAAWIKAKKAENKAKDKRVKIETEIEQYIPEFKTKSKTFREDGFKIEVKKNEKYSFNESWETIRKNIAEEFRPEKIKYEPVEKGLNYLKEKEPKIYAQVSEHVTFKPGKTGFKIEKEDK
jgi:hypothetical protein